MKSVLCIAALLFFVGCGDDGDTTGIKIGGENSGDLHSTIDVDKTREDCNGGTCADGDVYILDDGDLHLGDKDSNNDDHTNNSVIENDYFWSSP